MREVMRWGKTPWEMKRWGRWRGKGWKNPSEMKSWGRWRGGGGGEERVGDEKVKDERDRERESEKEGRMTWTVQGLWRGDVWRRKKKFLSSSAFNWYYRYVKHKHNKFFKIDITQDKTPHISNTKHTIQQTP